MRIFMPRAATCFEPNTLTTALFSPLGTLRVTIKPTSKVHLSDLRTAMPTHTLIWPHTGPPKYVVYPEYCILQRASYGIAIHECRNLIEVRQCRSEYTVKQTNQHWHLSRPDPETLAINSAA